MSWPKAWAKDPSRPRYDVKGADREKRILNVRTRKYLPPNPEGKLWEWCYEDIPWDEIKMINVEAAYSFGLTEQDLPVIGDGFMAQEKLEEFRRGK